MALMTSFFTYREVEQKDANAFEKSYAGTATKACLQGDVPAMQRQAAQMIFR